MPTIKHVLIYVIRQKQTCLDNIKHLYVLIVSQVFWILTVRAHVRNGICKSVWNSLVVVSSAQIKWLQCEEGDDYDDDDNDADSN